MYVVLLISTMMMLTAAQLDGAVPLESILCTEELHRRPCRLPDRQKESCALMALASALANSPQTVLQTLAEQILHVTEADSSVVALLTTDEGGKGSIGQLSPENGNRTSEAARHTTPVPPKTSLIVTVLCC